MTLKSQVATSTRQVYTTISMESQVYEFSVQMACEGCVSSVTNVLVKTAGVHEVKIDLEEKKVFVKSIRPSAEVLEAIKKTGMTCEFIGVKT